MIAAIVSMKNTDKSNKQFKTALLETGFTVEKEIVIGDSILFVDNTNKKWAVKEGRNSPVQILNFTDLIEFEIYEDGNSIANGRAGSALAGGLLFGVVGAVVGASRSKKVENTCSSLQLRVTVNDFNRSERVLTFIKTETKKDSFIYKNILGACKTMASTLSYIQNDGKLLEMNLTSESQRTIEEKIRQLSELMKDGLINNSEFEEKRKELLSRI